jgi:hypothetical protein
VFLGSPAEGLTPQSHQDLTVACGEGFLGKAKNNRYSKHVVRQVEEEILKTVDEPELVASLRS